MLEDALDKIEKHPICLANNGRNLVAYDKNDLLKFIENYTTEKCRKIKMQMKRRFTDIESNAVKRLSINDKIIDNMKVDCDD